MAFTTLIVTFIHLTFVFAHLFVPLWRRGDREKIAGLIRAIREKAAAHPDKKVPEADCRRLATAYYFPWEHGIVLGTLCSLGAGGCSLSCGSGRLMEKYFSETVYPGKLALPRPQAKFHRTFASRPPVISSSTPLSSRLREV
uniref:Uncharacterized protein n=1 Tax=Candidatus Kentrum sp. SD TaxID=2126332 RepID=A0A450Y714_9GAMM|nr:MAG: hypothetical protein BECKSD772F_GA0070984_101345 [Candidatus Kentron sp. SD]VFK42392.1 MAG: hypothetical protein BECKSD772E_GA0070983_101641 [Candidatus Kentron sp. SD]VFK79435.1 MAG: hypothetical protein BECKSD772D_GA0070982_10501 [Candidatus Kentron sp. SD]